jgi:hypothetical protein
MSDIQSKWELMENESDININSFETKLNKEPDLRKAITELIEISVSNKKFSYKIDECTFDYEHLVNANILIQTNDLIEFADSAILHYVFLSFYSKKLSYELTINVAEAFLFLHTIKKEIGTDNREILPLFAFLRKFNKFLLYLLHKELNLDFNKFILSLSKESGDTLYEFNEAYSEILPYLETPRNILVENLKHLLEMLKSDATFDSNTGKLLNAISDYCSSNIANGKELLQYSMSYRNPVIHNLNIPIIAGIYKIEKEFFWKEIVQFYQNKENDVTIICALSSIRSLNDEIAIKHYELITSKENFETDALANLPKFFTSIIKCDEVMDLNLKKSCFAKLSELIINPLQNVRIFTLREIQYTDGHSTEIFELLKKLIVSSDFNKEQLPLIGHVLYNQKNLSHFIDLLKTLSEKLPFDFEPDHFNSILNHFYCEDSDNFCLELVKLLTHNRGEVRFIGNKIIDVIPVRKLSIDILKLDAILQYKLWMSILGEIRQPKDALPILIPLVNSTFSIVKEAFILKLELLTEDYSHSVIDVLKEQLDLTNEYNLEIFNQVNNYYKEFRKNLEKKFTIKELDSRYTHSKAFRFFTQAHRRYFSESVMENADRKSFFTQMFKTVILAKNGGWKHKEDAQISKLSPVGVSMQYPRSMFILPELNDMEYLIRRNENWENKFKLWEAIISS